MSALWKSVERALSVGTVVGGSLRPTPSVTVEWPCVAINRNQRLRWAPPQLTPLAPDVAWTSPSGSVSVSISTGEGATLTVFRGGTRAHVIPMRKICGHIPQDASIQNVAWNDDETRFLFCGDLPVQRRRAPWDTDGAPNPDATMSQFEQRESWGEGLDQLSSLALFKCDVLSGNLTPILPSVFSAEYSAMCPVWGVGGRVYFIALPNSPRRLGLRYFNTRPTALFSVECVDGNEASTPTRVLPQITRVGNLRREGNALHFFVAAPSPAHFACAALWTLSMSSGEAREVVPVFDEPAADGFCGLYPTSGDDIFPIGDGSVLVNTIERSTGVIYRIHADGSRTALKKNLRGTWSVLDASEGRAMIQYSDGLTPARVTLHNLSDGTDVEFYHTTTDVGTELAACESFRCGVPDAHDSEYVFYRSKAKKHTQTTIVSVHGGPHSCDHDMFLVARAFWLMQGRDVMTINYGGSLGFGQRRIDALRGNIGQSDVGDVWKCIRHASAHGLIRNVDRMVVSGGSHGGFLAAHLSRGNFFRAALIRNPVIHLPSMAMETDIPDWVMAEVGSDDMAAALEKSPWPQAMDVKTPTLLALGEKDLRVPLSQGRAWTHALRAAPHRPFLRTLSYADGHPLATPQAMADFIVEAEEFMQTWADGERRGDPQQAPW